MRWRVTDAPGGNHSQAMIGYETEIRIILNSNLNLGRTKFRSILNLVLERGYSRGHVSPPHLNCCSIATVGGGTSRGGGGLGRLDERPSSRNSMRDGFSPEGGMRMSGWKKEDDYHGPKILGEVTSNPSARTRI